MQFLDKVFVITGANQGLGKGIADALLAKDAHVARLDIKFPEESKGSSGNHPNESLWHVDVTSDEQVATACQEIYKRYGRIDGLINNAGVVTRDSALETRAEETKLVLDINCLGALRMSQGLYPYLKEHQGAIVNISSTSGELAVKKSVGYGISKAALSHLTKVLALEWAEDNIRVNAVAPTIIPTDMTKDIRVDPEYMVDKLSTIPLNKMASIEDVVHAVLYLLDPRSSMITGQIHFVDGGVHIQ